MNSEVKTVLLATEGSSASAGARAAAAHLCRSGHAALHVAYATSPWTSADAESALAWALVHTEGRFIEEQLGCGVAGLHVPHGFPVAAILGVAKTTSADLVVVGGRRLGFAHRLLTYRVSRGVVESAPVPVLMVPGGEATWPPQHVVVGCDGSAESRRAADLAAWIAVVSDADLVIASVAGAGGMATEAEANRAAETCAAEVRRGNAVRRISTRVATSAQVGTALHDLCQATPGRVLLAVGARGSGVLRRPDHPSVSTALTESMRIPMLLAPPGVLARLGTRRARSLTAP